MDKPLLTEEQAREMIRYATCPIDESKTVTLHLNTMLYNLKQAGYIKKDIVEEAEEMYNEILTAMRPITTKELEILANKQHEAIKYLKELQK